KLRQDRNDTIANDNNDVRIQLNEIRSIGPHHIHVARRPTLVELNVPALGPSQPCQFLPESPNVRLIFRVAFRVGHQDANPPHLTGLLRARRERPRHSRAAEHDDELAPSYVEHGATSPALDRRHPTMTTRRPTAHAVGLLHAESTMEDGVESLGADLKCSESSPDRYCPAVVSLKVRIEPTRPYESFDRARLLRLSRGVATDAPARLRAAA